MYRLLSQTIYYLKLEQFLMENIILNGSELGLRQMLVASKIWLYVSMIANHSNVRFMTPPGRKHGNFETQIGKITPEICIGRET